MDFPRFAKELRPLSLVLLALLAASVGPNIFPAAEAGYGELNIFAIRLLLPAIAVLVVIVALGRKWEPAIARSIVWGALAGGSCDDSARSSSYIGLPFGLHAGEPSSLDGSVAAQSVRARSVDRIGHRWMGLSLWNGASFGVIYVLVFGAARRWAGVLYGIAVGVGFMLSPVVVALGVGYFGLQFSDWFSVTVLTAHIAFGFSLGLLAKRFLGSERSPLWAAIRSSFTLKMRHAGESPS